jgi:hypothetical protein
MDKTARTKLIAQYRDGYRQVNEALAGAAPAELAVKPGPGKWSALDVVHHLADSEMTAAIRLRRLIAEDAPHIQGYDQDQYAEALYYDRPLDASLQAFRFARETTAQILERLTDSQWQRKGTHSETGPYGVEKWLEIYAKHAAEHAAQIRRALEAARAKR